VPMAEARLVRVRFFAWRRQKNGHPCARRGGMLPSARPGSNFAQAGFVMASPTVPRQPRGNHVLNALLEPQNVDMGEVGHAAPSGTVVSEFVERPHGASAAAIVRSSEPILIRPRSTGSVSIVGSPMHRSAFATLIETLARG